MDSNVSGREVLAIAAFFVTIIAIVVASFWLADMLHNDEAAISAILLGLATVISTLTRPWVFWHHRKAVFLRSILGDTGTTVVYLLIGVGLVTGGAIRYQYWNEDVAVCTRLYSQAVSTHYRVLALQHVPRPTVPGILDFWSDYKARTCGRYREAGSF
jgi:formate-dependent nitrite reductase membrane component NrfD